MTQQRDHFVELFTYVYGLIKRWIVPLLTGVWTQSFTDNNSTSLTIFLALTGLVVWILVSSFMQWWKRIFEIDEGIIRVSEGVVKKSQNDIALNRIKSLSTTDTLIKRVFDVSDLNLELIGGKQVTFTLKNKEIKRLKEEYFEQLEIENSHIKTVETSEGKKIKWRLRDYALIATTNMALVGVVASIMFPLITKAMDNFTEREMAKGNEVLEQDVMTAITDVRNIIIVAIALIVMLLMIYVVTIGVAFLTYNNFRLQNEKKGLTVEYGLTKRKKYYIPHKQLRTLIIREPLFYRLLGYVQIKVVAIGLGEGGASSVLIQPLLKKSEIEGFIGENVPMFEEKGIAWKPTFYGLLRRWKTTTIKYGIVAIIVGLTYPQYAKWILIPYGISMLGGYAKWRTQGMAIDKSFVVMQNRIFGTNYKTITRKEFVESTQVRQDPIMKKLGIYDCGIAYYSERSIEIAQCPCLKIPKKETINNYLK